MSKIKVAVIFGGVSSEHDISLRSATFVIEHMPKDKYEVVPIGITKKGRWLYYPGDVSLIATGEWSKHPDCASAIISPDKTHHGILKVLSGGQTALLAVDCIFPVLHGANGEDGTIQGLCTMSGVPYVGCDTLASACCMDKALTHTILDYNGIKTAKWRSIRRSSYHMLNNILEDVIKDIGFPCFVKPANAGSSVGVSKASDARELKDSVKLAFTHDKKVVIEEAVFGKEVECAVKGNNHNIDASDIGEIKPANEFYDYEAKYISNESILTIPAQLDKNTRMEVQEIAQKAYFILGCSGLARIDFFVTDDHSIILNEVNTLPGFTSISMYPKLWEYEGLPSPVLIDELIELAIEKADFVNG